MSLIEKQFRAWEEALQRQPMSVKRSRDEDGGVELRPQLSPPEMLAGDKLEERWAQQYVKEEFHRLGFTKVEGSFPRGPDFRVLHKQRWYWAEVETRWKNYLYHKHDMNPAFDSVEYLILLSSEMPPPGQLSYLPPQIIYIDRQHFLAWYEKAAESELLGKEFGARVLIVASAMQRHWTTICSDVERDMATCPNCNSCAYFGNGGFGESTPFYQDMAKRFLISTAFTDAGLADLRNVNAASLERYVEEHPPGGLDPVIAAYLGIE